MDRGAILAGENRSFTDLQFLLFHRLSQVFETDFDDFTLFESPLKTSVNRRNTHKDGVVYNPRGSMYEDDGYPSGGLLRAYKNFQDWAIIQERGMVTAIPRGIHWLKLSWCPHCFVWRATTVCGVMGMVFTVLMLLSGIDPNPASATNGESPSKAMVAADRLHEQQPQYPIVDATQRPLASSPAFAAPAFATPPASDFSQPLYDLPKPSLGVVMNTLRDATSSWSRPEMVVSQLSALPDILPAAAVQVPYVEGWFTGDPNVRRRSLIARNVAAVTPYSAVLGVVLTSAQLIDTVRPDDTAPKMANATSTRNASFMVNNHWPDEVKLGKPAVCEVIVRNTSGQHVDQVRIQQTVYPFERVTGTWPSAGVVDESLVWDESDWPAGEERVYTMTVVSDGRPIAGRTTVEILNALATATTTIASTLRPNNFGTLPVDNRPLDASPPSRPMPRNTPQPLPPDSDWPDNDWPAEATTRTPVRNTLEVLPADPFPIAPPRQPATVANTNLRLLMILPQANVGEVATIQFKISNLGPVSSKQTRLLVTLPDALRHPHGKDLILSIGQLKPGESYQTKLFADVVRAGRLDIIAATDAANAEREEAEGTMSFDRPVSINSRPESRGNGIASVDWR